MSLVGSLEDLGLADILQIVSLARKSGLLLLRSVEGDGRIVFSDGLVRAAYVKGEPEDLRGVLVASGMAEAEAVDAALDAARDSGRPRDELLAERTGLTRQRLDSLRREHVERSVLRMFRWRVGEFSFDVRDAIEARDQELALPTGINAQFLTMEATRLGDELEHTGEAPVEGGDDDFVLSGESGPEELVFAGEESAAPEARDEPGKGDEDAGPAEAPAPAPEVAAAAVVPVGEDPRDVLALATAAGIDGAEQSAEPVRAADVAAPAARRSHPVAGAAVPLIVIESDLRILEWIKQVVSGHFARVHIFQRPDAGIDRIRQYLVRGEIPSVLVSCDAGAAHPGDTGGTSQLLQRLRAQAPRMPILLMHDGEKPEAPGLDAADARVARPSTSAFADRRRRGEVEQGAAALVAALAPWNRSPGAAAPAPAAATLERLRVVSERLRDPATRGDVLTLVMEFAAESFRRVAMFMVRDDDAVGLAQRGLPAAGGPDDAGLRGVCVPLREPACFRAVVASGRPQSLRPSDEGDRRLAALLGDRAAPEVYVAPIESGGSVAALLYADNLPDGAPMHDPAALAVVLHEAGLALDRALLERALAQLEG